MGAAMSGPVAEEANTDPFYLLNQSVQAAENALAKKTANKVVVARDDLPPETIDTFINKLKTYISLVLELDVSLQQSVLVAEAYVVLGLIYCVRKGNPPGKDGRNAVRAFHAAETLFRMNILRLGGPDPLKLTEECQALLARDAAAANSNSKDRVPYLLVVYARTLRQLARAYMSWTGPGLPDRLDAAERCMLASLALSRGEGRYPQLKALAQINCHPLKPGNPSVNLNRAIEFCNETLQFWTRSEYPEQWCEIHDLLGSIYSNTKLEGDRLANLDMAVLHWQLEADLMKRDNNMPGFASVQTNIANNLHMMEGHENYPAQVENAIERLQLALEVDTAARDPVDWGYSMSNLGVVYLKRPTGDRLENIHKAIECQQKALLAHRLDISAGAWCVSASNMATALLELGTINSIRSAMMFIDAAVEVSTIFTRSAPEPYYCERRDKLRAALPLFETNACPEHVVRDAFMRWNVDVDDEEVDVIILKSTQTFAYLVKGVGLLQVVPNDHLSQDQVQEIYSFVHYLDGQTGEVEYATWRVGGALPILTNPDPSASADVVVVIPGRPELAAVIDSTTTDMEIFLTSMNFPQSSRNSVHMAMNLARQADLMNFEHRGPSSWSAVLTREPAGQSLHRGFEWADHSAMTKAWGSALAHMHVYAANSCIVLDKCGLPKFINKPANLATRAQQPPSHDTDSADITTATISNAPVGVTVNDLMQETAEPIKHGEQYLLMNSLVQQWVHPHEPEFPPPRASKSPTGTPPAPRNLAQTISLPNIWRAHHSLLSDQSLIPADFPEPCRREVLDCLAWANKLSRNASEFGLIHSDMSISNFQFDQSYIDVFNFDQVQAGWYLYDLAAPLFTVRFLASAGWAGQQLNLDVPLFTERLLSAYLAVRPLVAKDTEELLVKLEPYIRLRKIFHVMFSLRVNREKGHEIDFAQSVLAWYMKSGVDASGFPELAIV